MKRLCLFFFLVLPVFSQSTSLIPDCVVGPITTTAATRFPSGGYNNANGCVYWTIVYKSRGFSVISIELDSSEDSASGPASWGAFNGTAQSSTVNPMASLTGSYYIGTAAIAGYVPWISINLATATGTGSVTAYAYGYRSDIFFGSSGGGGGGGSGTGISPCTSQAEVPLSGTGYTQIVAGSVGKVIYLCNVAWSSASTNVPVVNTFALAFGTCAGSPTQALNLPGITGYTDNFTASLAGASGAALCASESVANSDTVTVTYLQK